MQRTTFVAQPAHLSMSAMRRILSPAAVPTDAIARVDSLQPNTMMFLPSSSSSSSPSLPSSPHWSQRKRRGSIAQPTSQQVIPIVASSPVSLPNLSASVPITMTYQSDMYDTHIGESDDEFDDDLLDEDPSDDQAMWTSHAEKQRSSPVAIPNAETGCHSEVSYPATPALPDPQSIVTSYLVRNPTGRRGLSSRTRTPSPRRTSESSMHRSPFAPAVSFSEIRPGKPDTEDSMSKRMAYFDEDALY